MIAVTSRPRCLLAGLLITVLLGGAACSDSRARAKPTPLGAAEPATAPSSGRPASGATKPVGQAPEGAVYDTKTGLLAVAVRGPNRLLLLDGRTLALRRSVPVPGHARHLQLAAPGGPVLFPAESANSLVEVSLPGGTTRVTPTGKSPHDAGAVADGRIVVGDEFGASITIVRNGRVERTVKDLSQPGGVVGDGNIVGIVDVGAFTLSTYDPATGRRLGRVNAGQGPTHGIRVAPNTTVVSDTRGDALLTFSLSPLRQTASIPLTGAPYGLAFDPQRRWLWVTLTASNEVVAFDTSGRALTEVARYPTVQQPDTVAVAPGSGTVWVTGTRAGVIERITR